ncbi:EF-hand domain-containing protein [Chitinophaga rhizophila]|uniref:EF-hand domain-containing protein n=1 Tax=Chitinophaga rhizophila TaxID=2866212 RepID=A0ABS7GA59_9BACT|nr:EF-hand domain-containing protein [Chitinophaga rhizophila]MBW8684543.1 EF-hand domain-containing protein [Chitinophaga rhizophila]
MNRRFFTAAIIVTALTTVNTYAQEQTPAAQPKPKHEGIFQKLDTDKDGKISKAEADKQEQGKFRLSDRFSEIDANADTYITKEEMMAYWKKKGHGHRPGGKHTGFFQRLDTDKDGKISKAEAAKMNNERFNLTEKFSQIDANNDAYITKEEMFAYGKKNGHQPHGTHKRGEGLFQKLDADKDGKISKAEADKQEGGRFILKDKFAVIDTNKDSYIDKNELGAYRKSQYEKRKEAVGK